MPMNCEHLPERAKLTLTPNITHYGRWDCGDCGKFLGWEARPATKERIAEQQRKLSHCKDGNGLTDWEKHFVAGLNAEKLSPKQRTILDRICRETGYAG